MWTAIGAALGCCFLIKGGTTSDFLVASVIGAANGIAVGFAVGPAEEKGSVVISGLFAGTPFYFIGISGFVMELVEALRLHRGFPSGVIPIVSIFLAFGIMFSLARALRVRKHTVRPDA
jgi:hypothetical protein